MNQGADDLVVFNDDDGLIKALQGVTTIEEVIRATQED